MTTLPTPGQAPNWATQLNTAIDERAVPTGGAALQVLAKDSSTDRDTSWQDQLAVADGSANNPHTTEGASRNADLPKNFWQYTGTAGVDDPDNWISGDEWISA